MTYKSIVAGVDDSPDGVRSANVAWEIARAAGVECCLVHAAREHWAISGGTDIPIDVGAMNRAVLQILLRDADGQVGPAIAVEIAGAQGVPKAVVLLRLIGQPGQGPLVPELVPGRSQPGGRAIQDAHHADVGQGPQIVAGGAHRQVVKAISVKVGRGQSMAKGILLTGHAAHPWLMGRNLGPRPGVEEKLMARMQELRRRYDRKVSVIGWSLGGVYARLLANRSPEDVRCVLTLGTPFNSIPPVSTSLFSTYILRK